MQTSDQKAYKGGGMEERVARWYARTTRNDMEDFRRQARDVAQHLSPGCKVLEVAPGPGFFATELAKLGDFKITALDISHTMIEIAKNNAQDAGVNIDFQWGNASAIPFADESFDFIYCAAAFKNFSEPVKALEEIHRVLRPGGEAVVMDLRKDVSMEEINSCIKQRGRSRFDAWLTKWTFRCMLIKRAYTKEDFICMAKQSRFGSCHVKVVPIAFEVRFKG